MQIQRSMARNALVLGLFALVTVGLVAGVHQFTKERIKAAQREARGRAVLQLLPPGSYDNQPLDNQVSVFAPRLLGQDRPLPAFVATLHGRPTAVILQAVAPDGYSGSIHLLVGIDHDGRLSGVRVTAHKETPGLGDAIEAERSDWIRAFDGRALGTPPLAGWAVRRDGGEFDQFTGATITPRAVVAAVRRALEYFAVHRDTLFDEPAKPPAEAGK